MLRFSLFGFPVTIHWMFWVVAALLGGGLEASSPEQWQALLFWVAAALVSILIHELGHTFLQRHFGARAQIVLYSFGGLAIPDRRFSRGQDIVVSLAGPLVQIACGVVAYQVLVHGGAAGIWQLAYFMHSFFVVSIFWGLLNLLPIFPLDGGHVLLNLLGPSRARTTFLLGAACAAGIAVFMFVSWHSLWNTFFFGAMAWQNFQRSRGVPPPPLLTPR